MGTRNHTVRPTVFRDFRGSLQVTVLRESELNASVIATFLSSATSNVLGVAASYGHKSALSALVFATETSCLHITLSAGASKAKRRPKSHTPPSRSIRLLQDKILCHHAYRKLAFDAERISCGLHLDYGLRISALFDAQSLEFDGRRDSIKRLTGVLGAENVDKDAAVRIFDNRLRGENEEKAVVVRAWATWRVSISDKFATLISTVPPICTKSMDKKVIIAISRCLRDADQLTVLKPIMVKNDVSANFSFTKKGDLSVNLQRYTTRVRRGDRQHILVETSVKGSNAVRSVGTVGRVKGKQACLKLAMSTKDAALATIEQVYTVGPENATGAELARTEAILDVLQGDKTLLAHPLAKKIHLGGGQATGAIIPGLTQTVQYDGPLNDAQRKAVQNILSGQPKKAITVIQGPPGTGKTTVIAASVTSMAAMKPFISKHGIWLVAHSNIAVKQMAEKLVNIGFHDFKLLVSKDFHFEWHEHLYSGVLNANLIPSAKFPEGPVSAEVMLAGSRVILCSLSMFASFRFLMSGFTSVVPVTMVIVDEASQIQIGDYLPLLNLHGKDLKKLVFIGDDKQLAPFGQDDLGTLRSVFEIPRLRNYAIFLDTQYRMPTSIGDFISGHVYDGRLKSEHKIHELSSCRFVDIAQGTETKAGHSFKNVEEAQYCIRIAKRFHSHGKAYRIITPYDGQRSYIEGLLKSEGIPWEDRCFNVDSFQGNEADHIIISIVRTEKVGFLSNQRRSNVMLSRCKRSMTICTNRAFVNGKASSTLLGAMCAEWGSGAWLSTRDILAGRF